MTTSSEKPLLTYFIRGTNPRGISSVESVQATSAQDAINKLRGQGFSDIQIETDDFTAAIPGGTISGPSKLSPEKQLKLRRSLSSGWIDRVLHQYKSLFPIPFVALIILAVRRFAAQPVDLFDLILSVALFIPAIRAYIRPDTPTRVLRRLEIHYLYGRFDKASELLPRLEEVSRAFLAPELAAYTTVEWRSRILAKSGRLDDALVEIETLRKFPTIPAAMFCQLQRIAHLAARDFQGYYECGRQLTQTDPDNPLGWLTMTNALAGHLDRPSEARACLGQLRKLPLGPEMQMAVRSAEAGVLLAEGDYLRAMPILEAGLEDSKALLQRMPMAQLNNSILRGELAIACAKTGDLPSARKYFSQARQFLEIHKVEPLLSRCKRELGIS